MPSNKDNIADELARSIADDVSNSETDEIVSIMLDFDKMLSKTIGSFNSINFDRDGFLAKLEDLELDSKFNRDGLKRILGSVKTDFTDVNAINNSDILLRRDIWNICTQMPEMHDVISIVRDAIIESDAVTGGISRSISMMNEENETYMAMVTDAETKHGLQLAIKNFCVPQTLMIGESYINVIPYKKLFAELEVATSAGGPPGSQSNGPYNNMSGAQTLGGIGSPGARFEHTIMSDENLKVLRESVVIDETPIENTSSRNAVDSSIDSSLRLMLSNISVSNTSSSVLLSEIGVSGLEELLSSQSHETGGKSFFEDVIGNKDEPNYKRYSHIKGCYLKYLDPLKVVPIRLDRKVIGYYYVTTSMDIQTNPTQPNGVLDISFQHYTKDRNLVSSLASIIMKSFDKRMIDKNIQLKAEIAEIIMAHRFNEGRLSFLYIPENEVVRLVVNEDENGKGHSIIEPALFPARMYLLLTLYNMMTVLNNNTTRIHYLRSSGLNKDYASQIQKAIRKFQSRRITVDDIYSYSGVVNKVGGIGEMVLPSGRGDMKALETDSIEATNRPIDSDFMELLRRQAISGTGVPAVMIMSAIDEVDFAKTLEVANTRFMSAVSSYKIDFNSGFTRLYQLILKYTTDMTDSQLSSVKFKFNAVKQSMLDITNSMISNFNSIYELVSSIYFSQDELQNEAGKTTEIAMELKRQLAEEYIPQIDYDRLDDIIDQVKLRANERILKKRATENQLEQEDIKEIEQSQETV